MSEVQKSATFVSWAVPGAVPLGCGFMTAAVGTQVYSLKLKPVVGCVMLFVATEATGP